MSIKPTGRSQRKTSTFESFTNKTLCTLKFHGKSTGFEFLEKFVLNVLVSLKMKALNN